jgi:hypothetical protein
MTHNTTHNTYNSTAVKPTPARKQGAQSTNPEARLSGIPHRTSRQQERALKTVQSMMVTEIERPIPFCRRATQPAVPSPRPSPLPAVRPPPAGLLPPSYALPKPAVKHPEREVGEKAADRGFPPSATRLPRRSPTPHRSPPRRWGCRARGQPAEGTAASLGTVA